MYYYIIISIIIIIIITIITTNSIAILLLLLVLLFLFFIVMFVSFLRPPTKNATPRHLEAVVSGAHDLPLLRVHVAGGQRVPLEPEITTIQAIWEFPTIGGPNMSSK